MHLGWVADGAGAYRGQMAVLVKPNGLLGDAYMAAIRPFRHLIVYPPAMRQIERVWAAAALAPLDDADSVRDGPDPLRGRGSGGAGGPAAASSSAAGTTQANPQPMLKTSYISSSATSPSSAIRSKTGGAASGSAIS